jgi:hypothetical protein
VRALCGVQAWALRAAFDWRDKRRRHFHESLVATKSYLAFALGTSFARPLPTRGVATQVGREANRDGTAANSAPALLFLASG